MTEMLFTEPVLIFMSLYLCLIYMLLYLFFFAFPIVFEGVHHMNDGITGLMFLCILVGILIALVMMHFWTQLYRKLYKAHAVEARLPPMYAFATSALYLALPLTQMFIGCLAR